MQAEKRTRNNPKSRQTRLTNYSQILRAIDVIKQRGEVVTVKAVHAETGISMVTIYKYAEELSISKQERGEDVDTKIKKAIANLRGRCDVAGMRSIAREAGLNHKTIRRHYKRHSPHWVEIGNVNTIKIRQAIVDLKSQGKKATIPAISLKTGLHCNTIGRHSKGAGVTETDRTKKEEQMAAIKEAIRSKIEQAIREATIAGEIVTIPLIASKTGFAKETVRHHTTNLGHTIKRGDIVRAKIEQAIAVIKKRGEVATITAVSVEAGVNRKTARKHLKDFPEIGKSKGQGMKNKKQKNHAQIIQAIDEIKSKGERATGPKIAEITGLSLNTIYMHYKKDK